jgi:hypothetical protein
MDKLNLVTGQDLAHALDRIRSKGNALLRFLSLQAPPDLTGVLESPLFQGLQLATNDGAIDRHTMTGIRFGYSGAKFVASTLKFTLVNMRPDIDDTDADRAREGRSGRSNSSRPSRQLPAADNAGPESLMLYVRTYAHHDDGPGSHRFEGFVIPRKDEVYFVQYSGANRGLSVATLPNGRLEASGDPFHKGLILDVDRADVERALASRVVFYRGMGVPAVAGPIDVDLLGQSLKDTYVGDKISRYIRDESPLTIERLEIDGKIDIHSLEYWTMILAYLREDGVQDYINSSRNKKIIGFARAPLRVETDNE